MYVHSGYSYRSNYGRPEQGCVSTYTGITHVAARAGGLGTTVDYTTSTTVSGTLEMWAQPIRIMYQERDLTLYTTSSFASSPSSPTPDTASETTNPDNDGTSLSSKELKILRNIYQTNLQRGELPKSSNVKAVKSISEIGPGRIRSELDAGAGQGQGRAAELE